MLYLKQKHILYNLYKLLLQKSLNAGVTFDCSGYGQNMHLFKGTEWL